MKKWVYILLLLLLSCVSNGSETIQFPKALIKIANKKIIIELADNPKTWEQGLMNRKSLEKDAGMLFIFSKSEILYFWMKNTYIPLDIGFFDARKKLLEVRSMKPLDETIITSSKSAKYALEMNKGWFRKNNIKNGARLRIIKKISDK